MVHLRGVAIDGEEVEPIFQLPPGYRPAQDKALLIAAPGEGSADIQLTVNGTLSGALASFSGTIYPDEGKKVSLDGIIFRAES